MKVCVIATATMNGYSNDQKTKYKLHNIDVDFELESSQ